MNPNIKKLFGVLVSLGYLGFLCFQTFTFIDHIIEASDRSNTRKHNGSKPHLPPTLPLVSVAAASIREATQQMPNGSPLLKSPPGQSETVSTSSPLPPNVAGLSGVLSPPPPYANSGLYNGQPVTTSEGETPTVVQPAKTPVICDEEPECSPKLGLLYPKLSLAAQFFALCGMAGCINLSWKIGVQFLDKYAYCLSLTSIFSALMGILSILAWAQGMLCQTFELHWQFWPSMTSFFYALSAPLVVFATMDDTSEAARLARARNPPPSTLTEAQERRWQCIEARRRELDQLLEATGGGDLIFCRGDDGTVRISRWCSVEVVDEVPGATALIGTGHGTSERGTNGTNGTNGASGYVNGAEGGVDVNGTTGSATTESSNLLQGQVSPRSQRQETDLLMVIPGDTTRDGVMEVVRAWRERAASSAGKSEDTRPQTPQGTSTDEATTTPEEGATSASASAASASTGASRSASPSEEEKNTEDEPPKETTSERSSLLQSAEKSGEKKTSYGGTGFP